jgi:hypothetical protein
MFLLTSTLEYFQILTLVKWWWISANKVRVYVPEHRVKEYPYLRIIIILFVTIIVFIALFGSSSYVNAQLTRDIILVLFTCLLKLLLCHYAFMVLIYVENYSSMLCVSFLFVFWKLLTFINLLILKNEPSIHACMIYQYVTHHYQITMATGTYCCFEKSMLLLQCSWAN